MYVFREREVGKERVGETKRERKRECHGSMFPFARAQASG